MSSTMRSLARPLRSVIAARPAMRTYATVPTKNPTPSGPMEPSREQSMPMGAFYEAILNTPQPIPDVKPEEPATSVKENLQQQAEAADAAPAKRGRKPKAKTEPAATATAGTAPTASAAASPKATAKEAAAKSTVSSSSPDARVAATVPSASAAETSPPVSTPLQTTDTSAQEKAKVIFGSSLAGPAERAERLAQIRSKSKNVAGVLVPPKPEEPDNCCMSGCVNCVWDRFRDEMEEWAMAHAEAERRIAAAAKTEASSIPKQEPAVDHTTLSMDDDGGGSETNWDVGAATTPQPSSSKIAKDFWDEELYKNVPVGIREFMKQEKKLKQKHMREGTSGG